MSTSPPDHPPPGAAPDTHRLGPTRARVLADLQDLGAPATAAQVAERLGAHVNTARFHLEALAAAGLVERASAAPAGRGRPGRPRVHYTSAAGAPAPAHRSYRLLAELLATQLSATARDPASAAAEAGRAHGRLAVASDRRPARIADAAGLVVDTLREIGFESSVTGAPTPAGDVRIDVTTCPFLEVAAGHLEVVCAVHRGLMEGVLEAAGAPLAVHALEPLVAPGHCIAQLGAR